MAKKSYPTEQRRKIVDQKTLDHLKGRLAKCEKDRDDIRKELAYIRQTYGINLAENPAYHSLLADEHYKLNEISQLKDEINRSVVEEEAANENVVGLGDSVELELTYSDDKEPVRKSFVLVGSTINPFGSELSRNSPIGAFILGKTIGTVGEAILPSGAPVAIKIISKK